MFLVHDKNILRSLAFNEEEIHNHYFTISLFFATWQSQRMPAKFALFSLSGNAFIDLEALTKTLRRSTETYKVELLQPRGIYHIACIHACGFYTPNSSQSGI
jgi:hypothetical protein